MFNKQLYNTRYHDIDLSNYSYLITGGAGFIGSNIVEYLLKYNAGHVRVLDNLSNGYYDNIKDFVGLPNFEFIEGDIRDMATCKKVVEGIDFISHQAALGSVPRSIENPVISNDVNVGGFLNILVAAKESNKLKKMVYAASSSTYGDSPLLPKIEGNEGNPLSPYSVTKLVNELYSDVFSKVYDFHPIGLRYFNIFGPKQNPNNPYAAVIPLFCKHFLENTHPIINGDGHTSRDFTFVENAVQANVRALFNNNLKEHQVFNVACGEETSLLKIIDILNIYTGKNLTPIYKACRNGDVKHSLADLTKISTLIGYSPNIKLSKGIEIVYDWYLKNLHL
jgi:UDP-N-acetylglucosamine 4-epimerase